MHSFVLADPSRCIGCRACEIACAGAHMDADMGRAMERGLPFAPRLFVVRASGVTAPVQCRQCEDAPCAAACPSGAVRFNGRSVEVAAERCIGCKACVAVCPVGAMQVADISGSGRLEAHKCDLCADRGQEPACVGVCPAAALRLHTPERLQKQSGARRRQSLSCLAIGGKQQ